MVVSDSTGATGATTYSWTIAPASSCTRAQLLQDPGFESGLTQTAWAVTPRVINGPDDPNEPPHSGAWDAWLNGYSLTHTDTLSQTVTIPSTCTTAALSFWLHIDTAETSSNTNFDSLKVEILNSSGTALATLHTYTNRDHNVGYAQHSFDLTPYIGQTITLNYTGKEDSSLQTSFVIDDTAINVS